MPSDHSTIYSVQGIYLGACHQKDLGLVYDMPHFHVPPTLLFWFEKHKLSLTLNKKLKIGKREI